MPVCPSGCFNGGQCVAPGTCLCPPQWHGEDCGLPVCQQGSFVADPSPHLHGNANKATFYRAYTPCGYEAWCNATNGFVCGQPGRRSHPVEPLWGPGEPMGVSG